MKASRHLLHAIHDERCPRLMHAQARPRIAAMVLQHTSAYVSIRQHTSAYVSIHQHTPAYVRIRVQAPARIAAIVLRCLRASAYSSTYGAHALKEAVGDLHKGTDTRNASANAPAPPLYSIYRTSGTYIVVYV